MSIRATEGHWRDRTAVLQIGFVTEVANRVIQQRSGLSPLLAGVKETRGSCCGQKARALAEMASAGLRIPPSLFLKASYSEMLFEQSGVEGLGRVFNENRSQFSVERDAVAQRLTSQVESDENLQDALRMVEQSFSPAAVFVVRSSSVAEDLAGRSFAGIYESVVGAGPGDSLLQSTAVVISSAFSERYFSYERARTQRVLPMGVIFQPLVDCIFSGVGYTNYDSEGCAHLEIIRGLLQPLVQGAVTPSAFRLDAIGALRKTDSGRQEWQERPGRGRVSRQPASPDIAIDELGTGLGEELQSSFSTLERLFGPKLDVEWGIEPDHTLTFFQARSY